MIMKQNVKKQIYYAPQAEIVEFQVEQCIAGSTGGTLNDMGNNEIFDENF